MRDFEYPYGKEERKFFDDASQAPKLWLIAGLSFALLPFTFGRNTLVSSFCQMSMAGFSGGGWYGQKMSRCGDLDAFQ